MDIPRLDLSVVLLNPAITCALFLFMCRCACSSSQLPCRKEDEGMNSNLQATPQQISLFLSGHAYLVHTVSAKKLAEATSRAGSLRPFLESDLEDERTGTD